MMDSENCLVRLNELAQRTRLDLKYEDVSSAGPDHKKTFTVRAVVNGKVYPSGVGSNKKEAKHNAAKNALQSLLDEEQQDQTDSRENAAENSPVPAHQKKIIQPNYVCWLNEYSQRNKVLINAVESTRLGPSNATLGCCFVVGEKEYPTAYGETKKEAKEEAAKLAYLEICGSKTIATGDEQCDASHPQKEQSEPIVSTSCKKIESPSVETQEYYTDQNFVGLVNEHCQKKKLACVFHAEQKCGPPHNPQFFYKLVINNKEYPLGQGKTVKDAKQNAARLAWYALQEQSDLNSQALSTLSDDVAADKMSTPPLSQYSFNTDSESMPAAASDSLLFNSTSNPLKIQDPDVRPKRRIAANFPSDQEHSKEDIVIPDFKAKNIQNKACKAPSTQSVISRFTSEYDSIEHLGKGAFGRVFKAKNKLLEKYYAIKIVRCKEKALREVGALSDLHHTNIVRYYTCWMEDREYQWYTTGDSCATTLSTGNSPTQYLYIEMELCETKTLRLWIDEKNMQNAKKSLKDSKRREESLTIAQQLISGVEYIHLKMFIHRDLKPANILFGRDGGVKIGDFGLVTAEIDDDEENLKERTVYKGTPSYMAPEQKNQSTYDHKVDIFALGLIYFELVWNLSFGQEKKLIWDDARNRIFPQGFSLYFPFENNIIKSMLCLKPEDRPEAREVKAQLEDCERILSSQKNWQGDRKTV